MNVNSLGYIRVAAATGQVNIGAPGLNARHILQLCQELQQQNVSVAVFPELCISGYSAEDLFFSEALLHDCRTALAELAAQSPLPLLVVGAPLQLADGRLLNCAFAIGDRRVLGVVPKSVNPNHGEFYDLRWFSNGGDVNERLVCQQLGTVAVRTDQLFVVGDSRIGIEICEDLWAPNPPSTAAALAGAEVILNLSASNELIAKADYRRDLVRMTSARILSGYVYSAAAPTESTKDVVFGGHCMIAENGQLLTESERFNLHPHHIVADIDLGKLRHERARNTSFANAQRPRAYSQVTCQAAPAPTTDLLRPIDKQPFVPQDEHEFAARAQEIMQIQATGLARRMQAAHSETLVIGLSGGLDSTLAFLVCLDALAKLGLPAAQLLAVTMPGPGTSSKTLDNARSLAQTTGAQLVEIAIDAAVAQHLQDLQHTGEHDIVFENSQARERTQILFNYANKVGGLVVGTGDLSELALGWCTFNADHMASYNVNASVPKTLIAYLVRWYAQHRADLHLGEVLQAVLATPISPELIPPSEGEISQITEDIVGPYQLHDFFLFHFLRHGAGAEKIYWLACQAFQGDYDQTTIRHWLGQFFQRFYSQQFKRTTLPPGPKVGSVSLSPRGDWRMPDEANVSEILAVIAQLPASNTP